MNPVKTCLAMLLGVAIGVLTTPSSAQTPWPMFQLDAQHTGHSPADTSGNNAQLKWKLDIAGGAAITSSPAIGNDGTTYVSSFGFSRLQASGPSQDNTTTIVNCPGGVSYNGQAQMPCNATVTGSGFSQTLDVTYFNNTNAGTATANASFGGDSTNAPSSGSAMFNIAPAPVVITAGGYSGMYDGSTHAFSTCTVAGSNFDNLSCINNPPGPMGDVGSSIVMPMISSDASNYSVTINTSAWSITPAASITTVTCPVSVIYNGAAQTPCSATVTGINLSQPLQVVYTNNVNTGTATANAEYSGDLNHTYSSGSTQFTIAQAP